MPDKRPPVIRPDGSQASRPVCAGSADVRPPDSHPPAVRPERQPTRTPRQSTRANSSGAAASADSDGGLRVSTVVSAQSRERFRERAQQRRRRMWRPIIAGGVALVILAAVGYVLFFSPLLAVSANGIVVEGTGSTVDKGAVLAAVKPAVGVPVARVDTSGLARAVESVTGVRTARVVRAWPRGLTVKVDAREVAAAVPIASGGTADGGGYDLVDVEGVRIGHADAAPAGIPTVDIPANASHSDRALTAALTVLGGLPSDLRAEIAQLGADSPDTVRFTLTDGATVVWGDASDGQLKADVLRVLRAQQQSVSEYDVSSPRSPVTR